MIELAERAHPMPVFVNRIRPYFIDPADAGPAVILPTFDAIYVKQVLIGLADRYQQIVIPREPDAPHSRVCEDEPLRDVAKSEPVEPSISPSKSCVRLQVDQIDVIGLNEHILGFVKAAMKNLLADAPPSRHADPRVASPILDVRDTHRRRLPRGRRK
jgi:hypothetical protein